jgi:hypothetical protein
MGFFLSADRMIDIILWIRLFYPQSSCGFRVCTLG